MHARAAAALLLALAWCAQSRYTTTTPVTAKYEFDGVDYFQLPPHLLNRNTDCEYEYTKCLSNINDPHEICAYMFRTGSTHRLPSICTDHLITCQHRYINNWYKYGHHDNENTFSFFMGEDIHCRQLVRRSMAHALRIAARNATAHED